MKPTIIEIMIETTEMYIVTPIPLSKNFRLVNPSTLFGERMNQPNSCPLQEDRGNIKSKKSKFLTFKL